MSYCLDIDEIFVPDGTWVSLMVSLLFMGTFGLSMGWGEIVPGPRKRGSCNNVIALDITCGIIR